VPPICNANAVINCPHQSGVVKPVPRQMQVNVVGAPALRISDLAGAPVLPGCTNVPTPVSPNLKPCTTVPAPAVAGSTKVLIGGQPALLQTSLMSTDCSPPVPNGTTVKFAGQTIVNANG
jgi:hypothetical protein